jgi:hypothetical protein
VPATRTLALTSLPLRAICALAISLAFALYNPIAYANQFNVIAKTGDHISIGGLNVTAQGFEPPQANSSGDLAYVIHTSEGGSSPNANSLLVSQKRNGTQRLIAQDGATAAGAPGNGTFGMFGQLSINDQGSIAFENQMVLPSSPSEYSTIWIDNGSSLGLIDSGLNKRDSYDGFFYDDTNVSIQGFNSAGNVLFHRFSDSFDGSVITSGANGYWLGNIHQAPNRVVVENDGVYLLPNFYKFDYLYDPASLLNDGRVVFSAQLTGDGVDSTNNDSIWTSTWQILVRDGQAAPGMATGVVYHHINTTRADGAGHLAYRAVVAGPGVDSSNSDALFSTAGGTPHLVARLGQAVTGVGQTAHFSSLSNGFKVQGDYTTFTANYSGPATSNGSGTFAERAGIVRPITYAGEAVPGISGEMFGDTFAYLLPGTDRFLVDAQTYAPGTDGRQGIWLEDQNHQLQPIVYSGSVLQIGNQSKVIENFLLNPPTSATVIPFLTYFTDGSSALLSWDGSISTTTIAGDFNNDGVVDARDYIAWRAGLGSQYTASDYATWRNKFGAKAASAGDFNHDGYVTTADYVTWRNSLGTAAANDYNAWRSHFGQSMGVAVSGSAAVPEPTSPILSAGLALALVWRRSRSH